MMERDEFLREPPGTIADLVGPMSVVERARIRLGDTPFEDSVSYKSSSSWISDAFFKYKKLDFNCDKNCYKI